MEFCKFHTQVILNTFPIEPTNTLSSLQIYIAAIYRQKKKHYVRSFTCCLSKNEVNLWMFFKTENRKLKQKCLFVSKFLKSHKCFTLEQLI